MRTTKRTASSLYRFPLLAPAIDPLPVAPTKSRRIEEHNDDADIISVSPSPCGSLETVFMSDESRSGVHVSVPYTLVRRLSEVINDTQISYIFCRRFGADGAASVYYKQKHLL